MQIADNDSKMMNNENDINKIDEASKGLRVKNTNVIIAQRNNLQFEKKNFCSDDVKKHVSILCKFEFISNADRFWLITFHSFFRGDCGR